MKLNPQEEPVRANLFAAGVVVAIATFLAVLGVADEWTPQVVATAGGAGLGEFAIIAYGVSRARDRVSPYEPEPEGFDAEADG